MSAITMGSLDENKQVVLRQIEALNAGDLEALGRLLHPDFFDHTADAAGVRLEPLDLVAEGDRVTVRARVDGDVSRQQIDIWRLRDGLLVEHWQSTTQEER
jgi:predicted SnoaL-like aldol condensation-catalyzing enzyme